MVRLVRYRTTGSCLFVNATSLVMYSLSSTRYFGNFEVNIFCWQVVSQCTGAVVAIAKSCATDIEGTVHKSIEVPVISGTLIGSTE